MHARTHVSLKGCLGTLALWALGGAAPARAELELPRESPTARVSQQVGLTDVVVDYASPAVNGRRIWGALVPYDVGWSISPSFPATIRFSRDVVVGTRPVAGGAYRLSVIPAKDKDDWAISLARIPAPGGPARLDAEAAPVRFKVAVRAVPPRERLIFVFSSFNEDKATLELEWERIRISIPIVTHTGQQVADEINELDNVWRSYANAARFMLETKKDYEAGLRYANQSLALKEDWYTYWIKGALLAAKRDYRGAVEQGQRAYELGQRLGEDFFLEADLKKALADWRRRSAIASSPGSN